MDYVADAERHRHMAEEHRTMADNTPDDGLRTQYCKLQRVPIIVDHSLHA